MHVTRALNDVTSGLRALPCAAFPRTLHCCRSPRSGAVAAHLIDVTTTARLLPHVLPPRSAS